MEEGDRVARLARNELLFRAVNERIQELGTTWGSTVDAVCECANNECFASITLPKDAIPVVGADRRHFFVVPGHEVPDVEEVVERHEAYFVVEKPADAASLAEL